MQKYALSIDCGSTGTGIACWDWNKWGWPVNPIYCMNFFPRKRKEYEWLRGALDIANQFREHIKEIPRGELVLSVFELPEYFDSALGNSVAKTGRLAKLVLCAGMLIEAANQHGSAIVVYPVHEWLGQVPKHVMIQRIRKVLPNIDKIHPVSHSFDAIGIGLYGQKLINQQRRAKDRPRVV